MSCLKILYIVGTCLTKNTSANMSHNAFVQGFLENNCQVDIIMKTDSWGASDNRLKKYEKAKYFEYDSVSFSERLRRKTRTVIQSEQISKSSEVESNVTPSFKQRIRGIGKSIFYKVFRNDPVYVNDAKWLKTAARFRSDSQYDIVVSNSSPAASHKLALKLITLGRIKTNRWIQIWEDPWFYDLYSNHLEAVRSEEHLLLQSASEIYYVSPLTCMYQKQLFNDCADKMKSISLPFLDYSDSAHMYAYENDSFGYFGDYYSITRNIIPFYEALVEGKYRGYIFGDNDLSLKSTDRIQVSERVTLDVLTTIQEKTEVLVHLSNLRGGQIPGKIYHYSATTKPILFILDGNEEEKSILREYFGKYDRFYFCENNKQSILEKMNLISRERERHWNPVDEFCPRNVVNKIIFDKTR